MVRNKDTSPPHKASSPPPHPLFSQAQLYTFIPNSSTSPIHGGMGNASDQSKTSLLLLPPHISSLPQHGSSSHAAVLQGQPVPAWDLQRLQFLQGISICSSVGSIAGCSVDICSGMVSPWASGKYLLHGFLQSLQGNICSSTAALPRPSSLTLVFLLFFSGFFFSPLLSVVLSAFLRHTSTEVPTFWLRGSAMPCSGSSGAGWNLTTDTLTPTPNTRP